ncbi:Uncharacterized protein GBIM_04061, partial [Gryllus bimaculatus]
GARVEAEAPGATSPLISALLGGHVGAVEALLRLGAVATSEALLFAVGLPGHETQRHRAAIVALLLRHGARPDAATRRVAALLGDERLLHMFMENGTDAEELGEREMQSMGLHKVSSNIATFTEEFMNKVDIVHRNDVSNSNPSEIATASSSVPEGREMKGADAEAGKEQPGGSGTALHAAVAAGDWALVARLVEEGADVDARDDTGATPLWMAAFNGQTE